MESYRYIHAKSSWMSAREALLMVEKLAEMGAEDGNIDSYMLQGVYGDYRRETGGLEFGLSDFIATVPLVYMITNGVELTLKGYHYAAHPDRAPHGPLKFDALLKDFHQTFADEKETDDFIRTYTEDDRLPALLADFMRANGMSIRDVYRERRFLNNTSFYSILDRYKPYHYHWEGEGKPFYEQVLDDARKVLPIIEGLQADIDSEGVPGEMVMRLRKG
jgi:hypothetical protein